MGLTNQMRVFDKVKHRDKIHLKFGDRFFISLTILRHEWKVSTTSTIKKTYSYTIFVSFRHLWSLSLLDIC